MAARGSIFYFEQKFWDENSDEPPRQEGPVSLDPAHCQQLKYTEPPKKKRAAVVVVELCTRPVAVKMHGLVMTVHSSAFN